MQKSVQEGAVQQAELRQQKQLPHSPFTAATRTAGALQLAPEGTASRAATSLTVQVPRRAAGKTSPWSASRSHPALELRYYGRERGVLQTGDTAWSPPGARLSRSPPGRPWVRAAFCRRSRRRFFTRSDLHSDTSETLFS